MSIIQVTSKNVTIYIILYIMVMYQNVKILLWHLLLYYNVILNINIIDEGIINYSFYEQFDIYSHIKIIHNSSEALLGIYVMLPNKLLDSYWIGCFNSTCSSLWGGTILSQCGYCLTLANPEKERKTKPLFDNKNNTKLDCVNLNSLWKPPQVPAKEYGNLRNDPHPQDSDQERTPVCHLHLFL